MRGAVATLVGAVVVVAMACGPSEARPVALRLMSANYSYTITPQEAPPHAREPIGYTVTVFDRKTRQPIEGGEGQIFAGRPMDPDNNPQGPQSKSWDGLAYGPELGTYRAKLQFVVPGMWAVAIRFRRDTLHPVERVDWYQDVLGERDTTNKR